MPRLTAIIVSAGKATLRELQTFYSVRDAHDMLEIIAVDNTNQRKLSEKDRRG